MAKSLMVLGASILQMPAIEKAVSMGLNVIALDINPEAIGFKVPGVVREVVSTIDIEGAIEVAKRHRIDGVMTLATDMPIRTVAAVVKECGLAGISQETAIKATDKGFMREALQSAGVPVPCFYTVYDEVGYQEAAKRFKVPFVVKPADSSGSRGITRITDVDYDAYEYAKSFSRSGKVIVEECMVGPEVSVETLAIDGCIHVVQITDKITTGAPHFVEIGHTQPSRLGCLEEIKSVAIAANKALGIENGPSHTEIIVTSDGPKIVELGARLGGDCIATHLVPLSTGVDIVEGCIKIALGEKFEIYQSMERGSAIRYFPQHAGIIKNYKPELFTRVGPA